MKILSSLLLISLLSFLTARDIASSYGDAGYYYDIYGGGTCGKQCGIKSFAKTKHVPMCEGRNPNPRRLIEYNTNDIVAIPGRLFKRFQGDFCGKRIVVSICGKERNDLNLIVWDGFRDHGDSGLRFSSSIFAELFGKGRCDEKKISGELSWRITDEQVIRYDEKYGGGAICLEGTRDSTPDIPFDDNVIVPGFWNGTITGALYPALDYCESAGEGSEGDLPVDTPFDDNVIVPGFTDAEGNLIQDTGTESTGVVESSFADNVIVPGLEEFTGGRTR